MPLVSIVTIVYNDREGLRKTCSSIESQSFSDFEWIIVDGDSTDGTKEFAKALHLPLVRVISEPGRGIFPAMNVGLLVAKGTFIVFLNAGDTFVNQYTLAAVAPLIDETAVDFLYGDSLVDFDNGEVLLYKHAWRHSWIKFGMFGCHQAMYYRRSVISDMRYDESFEIAGDYDFTARFLQNTNRVLYLHLPLCVFGLFGLSDRNRELGRKENWLIQRTVLNMSYLQCAMVRMATLVTSAVRYQLPNIYRLLRFKRNTYFP